MEEKFITFLSAIKVKRGDEQNTNVSDTWEEMKVCPPLIRSCEISKIVQECSAEWNKSGVIAKLWNVQIHRMINKWFV